MVMFLLLFYFTFFKNDVSWTFSAFIDFVAVYAGLR